MQTKLTLAAFAACLSLLHPAPAPAAPSRPNFLIIVADDLGFSDIGAFGGEIDTPNLDALARSGARLTSFHVSPTCSPTRVMLLTGVDHHRAGIGNMAELLTSEQRGKPGYEGHVNDRVATLAEELRAAGYHTLMSGKWHLGTEVGSWPADRGFERSMALLQGGANHFGVTERFHRVTTYVEDHKPVGIPDNFYSTDYFSDNLITLLNESKTGEKPFFAYLAFTAPHWPLQAPEALIAKYKGKYREGYEKLAAARMTRQKALGLLGPNVRPHPMVGIKPWDQLTPEEKAREERIMEVYAAMVDRIDSNIGRIVEVLKKNGQFDNTVIMVVSDNGAAGSNYEGVGTFASDFGEFIAKNFDNRLENIGRANSLVWLGPGWGQAQTAPSFLFKIFTSEGGLRVPLIVSGPGVVSGKVISALSAATDVAPTVLEMAGVSHQAEFNGRPVYPLDGVSLTSVLHGDAKEARPTDAPYGEELFGGRSLIKGDYKALYLTAMAANVDPALQPGRWALYNLRLDPGETVDLAAKQPAKLAELVQNWEAYARQNGVVLPREKPVGAVHDFAGGQAH